MMRESSRPVMRAASTNSFSRSESTCAADDARRVEPREEGDHEHEGEHAGREEPPNVISFNRSPAVGRERDQEQEQRERHDRSR